MIAPLTTVGASLDVSREMVRKWRVRFMSDRMEGLTDAPRPGAPRAFGLRPHLAETWKLSTAPAFIAS